MRVKYKVITRPQKNPQLVVTVGHRLPLPVVGRLYPFGVDVLQVDACAPVSPVSLLQEWLVGTRCL